MIAFFHSSRAINIASIVFGLLSGLYGFNSILGSRGGILRQLIVAIPSALLFGVVGYVGDIWAHHIYGEIVAAAFSFPTGTDLAFVVAIESAILGFMSPFLAPNVYRIEGQYQKQSLFSIVFFGTALFALYLFSGITEGLFLEAKGKLPFGINLSRTAIIVIYGFLALFVAVTTAQNLWKRQQNQGKAEHGDLSTIGWILLLASGIAGLVVTVVSVALLISLASLTGWAILFYWLLSIAVFLVIMALQYGADRIPRNRLLYISLVFFLLAGALQIYQAAVL